jgi:hypothetical protein
MKMKRYTPILILFLSLLAGKVAGQTCTLTSAGGTDAQTICLGDAITDITYTMTGATGGSATGLPASLTAVFFGTTLTISGTPSVSGTINYQATLTDGTTTCTSNGSITVNSLLPVSVSIVASANPVCAGTSVTFTATPTNGGSTPSYQWQVNSINAGTNSNTYSYVPLSGDIVRVVLTSDATCPSGNPATSSPITMNVNLTVAVSVTIAANANPVCAGTTVNFTATPVNGGITPSYQWLVNGSNAGTNSNSFSYVPVNGDVVRVILTSNATCPTGNPATSAPITMTVNPILPVSVSIVASANNICTGTSVTYTATPVNGGSSPSYQWYKGVSAVGPNSPTYSYTPADGDIITVRLTSNETCKSGSPATSNAITMTVFSSSPAKPGSITGSSNVCQGQADVNYSISDVTNALSYTWSADAGCNIITGQGTTDVTAAFDAAAAASLKIYVSASNTCGSSALKEKSITVNTTPTATIDVDGLSTTTVCQNDPSPPQVTFYNSLSSAITITYNINGANQTTIDVNASNHTHLNAPANIPGTFIYTLVSVKYKTGTSCSTNITGTATVIVTPTVGTPTAISVSAGSDPACQLTNGTTTTTYLTTAANSTGFNWSLSSGTAGAINASTGVMTWANGFSGSVNIRVTASGCNGPSSQVIRTVNVTPTVSTPTAITISGGTEPACQLPDGSTTTTYATSASNSTGFNWSLSNSSAGIINPSTGVMTWASGYSGTVGVQVTANGCNGPSSQVKRTVIVKPNVGTPTPITISAGTEPTCQLTNGTTTTTYSTTATDITGPYNWSLSNASAGLINATTGVMTWANGFSGNVNIQVTATGCNGASPMTIRYVSITPAVGTPTPITISAGNDPACQLTGGTTMTIYSTTATNSTGFNWSLSSGTAGTINSSNGLMTWANGFSGNVDIRVTASGCGTSSVVTRTVAVNPLPAVSITGPATPRITSTGNVYQTQTGMSGYTWSVSGGGTGTPASDNFTVDWNTGGNQTVSVNYIDTHGCTAVSPAVYNVSVKPIPAASNASISGYPAKDNTLTGTYTYTDGSTGTNNSTYRWLRNGTDPITSATGSTYIPTVDDINKTLTFEVTPVSSAGPPYSGVVIKSSPTEPVEDLTGVPVADEVCIEGIRAAGNSIRGEYRYTFSKAEGISTYKWLRKEISTGIIIEIGTARTYTLVAADIDDSYEIIFEVTPVSSNLTPIAGVPVQSGPLARILIPKTEFSTSERDVLLSANVTGGVFSGTAVSGNYFSPRSAGSAGSPYTITYLLITPSFCSQQASKQVIVNPNVSFFVGFNSVYCHDGGTDVIKVSGVPSGSTEKKFKITNINALISSTDSTITIDPGLMRPGVNKDSLYYSYKSSGIFYQISEAFNIDSVSTGIKILNLDSAYCQVDARKYISVEGVYPLSGSATWTGDIITDPKASSANVDPSLGTPGIKYPITYMYTSSTGCKSKVLSAKVKINPLPIPAFSLNDTYNIAGGPVNLVPVQTGGTFSGRGVSGEVLFPDIAGLGEDEIKYSITDINNCSANLAKKTTIRQAQGNFTDITSIICYRDTTYKVKITNLPTIGVVSITGFTNYKKTLSYTGGTTADYNVPAAGDGVDTLIFTYKWDNVDYTISKALLVDKLDQVYIKYMNPGDTICSDRQPFELTPSIYGGVFSGPVSGGYLDPSKATRADTVKYTYTNIKTGCSTSTKLPINVFPSPKVSFAPADTCIDKRTVYTTFNNLTKSSDPMRAWQAWNWGFTDENGAVQPDTNKVGKFLFKTGGPHKITLTATTITGCHVTKESTYNFGMRPNANFYWKNDCMHPNDSIILLDTTESKSQITSRSWSIFGGPEFKFSTVSKEATYLKSDSGFKKIQLIVRTKYANCYDTVKKDVYIRPTITVPADGYFENFENGRQGWIQGEATDSTWSFGKPDKVTINHAKSGESAWFTRYNMNVLKEESSIVSPCFDFAKIDKPIFEIYLWKRFNRDGDGAALQYKIGDSKSGWQYVGTIDDGIEWYNSAVIRGKPGGNQLGWTTLGTPDTSYVESLHTLDEVTGKSDVKFRIAYGSDGSSNQDGIAFDNIRIGERNRNILLEHFTNSTDIPSSNANTAVNVIAKNRKADVINIQYHTNFPGTDPFYTANPGDASARILFYGLTNVPYTFIDGGFSSSNFAKIFDNNLAKIDSNVVTKRSLKPSLFNLSLTTSISDGILSVSGKVKALDVINSDNLTLFLAVTEKVNKKVTGALGETEFYNVFRKFIPDAGGILLKNKWVKGEELNIAEKSWVIDKVLNNSDIEIIAFIQNTVTKEVYQASSQLKPKISTGIEKLLSGKENDFALYPNPAADRLTIEFSEPLTGDSDVKIYNLQGLLVSDYKTGSGISEYTIGDLKLENGIYMVRVSREGIDVGFKKLIITGH